MTNILDSDEVRDFDGWSYHRHHDLNNVEFHEFYAYSSKHFKLTLEIF